MNNASGHRLLHVVVVFIWLATAVVSVWERKGQGAALLAQAGVTNPVTVQWLILGGAALDALVGVAMLVWPSRFSYGAALALMALMTIVATVLLPSLWLHPLGPLSKNLPIAVALWILMRDEK